MWAEAKQPATGSFGSLLYQFPRPFASVPYVQLGAWRFNLCRWAKHNIAMAAGAAAVATTASCRLQQQQLSRAYKFSANFSFIARWGPNGTAVDQLQSQLQVGVMKALRLTATDVHSQWNMPSAHRATQYPHPPLLSFPLLTLSRCAVQPSFRDHSAEWGDNDVDWRCD